MTMTMTKTMTMTMTARVGSVEDPYRLVQRELELRSQLNSLLLSQVTAPTI